MRRDNRQARLGRFEQHEPAIRRQLRPQALDQRNKARFDKEQPVLGVVDDVDDLLVEEARVDRVAHRADAGDPVIQLEMAEIVPRQGADPVAGSDPEPQQRLCETPRAALGLPVGVAVDRPIDEAGDHLDIAVIARRVPDKRRDQQLPLRHQPAHASPPSRYRSPTINIDRGAPAGLANRGVATSGGAAHPRGGTESLTARRPAMPYIYFVQLDIPDALDAELNRIYDTEHVPMLSKVPGVRRVTRYRREHSNDTRMQKYLAIYEIDLPDIVESKA